MRTAAFATLLVGALAIKVKEDDAGLWGGVTVESIGEDLYEQFEGDSAAMAEYLYEGMDPSVIAEKAAQIQGVIDGDVEIDDWWLTDNVSMYAAGDDGVLDQAELLGLAAKLGATEDDGSAATAMSMFDWDGSGALDTAEQDALWR